MDQILNSEQLDRAKALHVDGLSWDEIAKRFQIGRHKLCNQLFPEKMAAARKRERERRNADMDALRRAKHGRSTHRDMGKNKDLGWVEAEQGRISQLRSQQSASQALMGDPLPGRSALDQKNGHES